MPSNAQLNALSNGPAFQGDVRASILKKSFAIVDDVRQNGNLNYTAAQAYLAKQLCLGGNIAAYYPVLACSTNVMASNITVSGSGETVSDISDAALDSQVYVAVFEDLL
jgi:hypothetical protein